MLVRRFSSPSTSLTAAFFLAISQLAIYYSQEARSYSMLQCVALVAVLCFVNFLENPKFRSSLLFALTGIILTYTHYYGAATLLALGIYWLIFRRSYPQAVFRWLSLSVVLMILASLPWLIAVQQSRRGTITKIFAGPILKQPTMPIWLRPISGLNRFNNGKFDSFDSTTRTLQTLPGMLLFTAPALLSLFSRQAEFRQAQVLAWLLTLLPFLMTILGFYFGAYFSHRYFAFAVSGYCFAVAMGWQLLLNKPLIRGFAFVLVIGLSLRGLPAIYEFTKPNYISGFQPIVAAYQPGGCISSAQRTWSSKLHFAYEIYFQNTHPLRFMPFAELNTSPNDCRRLWILRDKTDFMNLDPTTSFSLRLPIPNFSANYKLKEFIDHPVMEFQLLQKRP